MKQVGVFTTLPQNLIKILIDMTVPCYVACIWKKLAWIPGEIRSSCCVYVKWRDPRKTDFVNQMQQRLIEVLIKKTLKIHVN